MAKLSELRKELALMMPDAVNNFRQALSGLCGPAIQYQATVLLLQSRGLLLRQKTPSVQKYQSGKQAPLSGTEQVVCTPIGINEKGEIVPLKGGESA